MQKYFYPKKKWSVLLINFDGSIISLVYIDTHASKARWSAMKREFARNIISISKII